MKFIKQLFLIQLLLLGVLTINAHIIKGKVSDYEDRTALPRVCVSIKGTNLGTLAMNDGFYHLEVN